MPGCTTAAAGWIAVASALGVEAAAAKGVVVERVLRAADGDFAGLVPVLVPDLAAPARLGDVARPVLPTLAPVLPCADDEVPPLVESAWATAVAPFNAAQTPIVRVPAPSQIDSLLWGGWKPRRLTVR
ncbi:hypothetical protein Y900_020070 [Mycolicibacterium aromaticivorans JS19b1 = JCM 16368]|uniref:Uncharacterized protein n=1 Tax=Mycolicibacterium aromaticivorans JS19b1 = JCM 16368 TaxID=1440774 RepID=A0A064CKP3_9MYCO|nr:hypothetical protein Y900_020070 [Mycolicibacterium aromaticivorans JS19b1 = JCM 16368]